MRFYPLLSLAIIVSQILLYPASETAASSTREAHNGGSRHFETLQELETLSVPYRTEGEVSSARLAWCENVIAKAFRSLPADHVNAVKRLTLSFDPEIRRGLAGGNTMVLRCVDVDEAELVAVTVHEMGHIADTGWLHAAEPGEKTSFVDRGTTVYSTDPSAELYSVSWEDNRSFTGQSPDFVSGYAMTNPYEDFAESYAMYVLHGSLFRFYAEHNEALKQKYEFMKWEVFDGVEYDFTLESIPAAREAWSRVYDVTRLDYDLESFVALRES